MSIIAEQERKREGAVGVHHCVKYRVWRAGKQLVPGSGVPPWSFMAVGVTLKLGLLFPIQVEENKTQRKPQTLP